VSTEPGEVQRPPRTPATRWVVGLAAFFLLALALFYFVPGLPDSPQSQHNTHDLGAAALDALVVTGIGGLLLRFIVWK
jgi:hypothetical protein